MADVGRERGHARVDVDAPLMPPEDRLDYECVPQIVNARLRAVNTSKAKEPRESTMHIVVDESRAHVRNEEARRARARVDATALIRITTEGAHDGLVQDHLAGLAELALANDDELVGPINIAAIETDRFADAHASRSD